MINFFWSRICKWSFFLAEFSLSIQKLPVAPIWYSIGPSRMPSRESSFVTKKTWDEKDTFRKKIAANASNHPCWFSLMYTSVYKVILVIWCSCDRWAENRHSSRGPLMAWTFVFRWGTYAFWAGQLVCNIDGSMKKVYYFRQFCPKRTRGPGHIFGSDSTEKFAEKKLEILTWSHHFKHLDHRLDPSRGLRHRCNLWWLCGS